MQFTFPVLIGGNGVNTSRPIHLDYRLSTNHREYMHVSKAYYNRIVPACSILQCKNEKCMNFDVLLGIKVSDYILIANLVSISAADCPSQEYTIV